MARGTDWKTAKADKKISFTKVDRKPTPEFMSPAGATTGRNTSIELPTSGADTDSVGSWGFESGSTTSISQSSEPMNVTKDYDQSMNILTAEVPQDITITNATTTGGIQLQNDVTKNTILNESEYYQGEEKKVWEDNLPWKQGNDQLIGIDDKAPGSATTMQVSYNVPGGGLQTADVQTWKHEGKYYTKMDSGATMISDAKPNAGNLKNWVQVESQKGMAEDSKESALAWNALDPNSQANQGEGIAINRGGVDMFFGAKEDKREAIESAFKTQDFNKMWGNVKHNISSSMGINPKGNTFISTKEGDWDEGGFGVSDQYGNPSSISFGGGYSGKEKHNQHISEIFGFYKEKHKGNKDIITEIEAMQNRYLIGGNKSSNKGGGGATSGLFGFNNKGPQSTGNNPATYYTDMANANKKQSLKSLDNKANAKNPISQTSYDKQVANINKIYNTQKTNKNLYKAYGNPDFYEMGL